jgi:formylglycine-generating enzyme required for sulfatase activity
MRYGLHAVLLSVVFPAASVASGIAQSRAAIAKITVHSDLKKSPGTAFVVTILNRTAYLVTSAQVVAGDRTPTVQFEASPRRAFHSIALTLPYADSHSGLALLAVANPPAGIHALTSAGAATIAQGDKVLIAGYSDMVETSVERTDGLDLILSRQIDAGSFGAPVLSRDEVVGMVYGNKSASGTAISSELVRLFLRETGLAWGAPPSPSAGTTRLNPRDGLTYAWIPPGEFVMGCSKDASGKDDPECYPDEKPAHPVKLSKGFWIGQTEVTVAAWELFRAASFDQPFLPTKDNYGRSLNTDASNSQLPVTTVMWDEAQAFCKWAGADGLKLPTEAQWEYAARAGSSDPRYDRLDDIAWFADNSGSSRIDSTALWREDQLKYGNRLFANGNGPKPVAARQRNAWSLHDTLGNVWEWTADKYSDKYYSPKLAVDPTGPKTGDDRVLRGGAWNLLPRYIRVSFRAYVSPDNRGNNIGFRCAGELQ